MATCGACRGTGKRHQDRCECCKRFVNDEAFTCEEDGIRLCDECLDEIKQAEEMASAVRR